MPASAQKKNRRKRVVVGLTGSFGSGKSSVAGIFAGRGAHVIDADKIAHSLIRPASAVYRRIIRVFGEDILKKDLTIDRKKLGEVVFNDKSRLVRLNRIIQPAIIRMIKSRIRAHTSGIIVLDAPLLVEAGLTKLVDTLIVVTISPDKQVSRIMKKTGLLQSEIKKRIACQIPLAEKIRRADFVIDNDQTKSRTRRQALEVFGAISARLNSRQMSTKVL
ncbi:MAG: dephospho-CoA kinase [Candidatus Omnitrophota bacterium]